MLRKMIIYIKAAFFLLIALFLFETAPLNAQQVPVTQNGCFIQSGDGGDKIISDINGYAVPPPTLAAQVTPVIDPKASWPFICGSGKIIADNQDAWTTPALPATLIIQRTFSINPGLVKTGSFGITFGMDDVGAFVVTNSLYPSGVTIASCYAPGGVCLKCQNQNFNGNYLDGSGPNTLTICLVNTGNITIGTHLGFSWIYYSICVSGGTPSPISTPAKPPSPATNTSPSGGFGFNWVEMMFALAFGGVIALIVVLMVFPALKNWFEK